MSAGSRSSKFGFQRPTQAHNDDRGHMTEIPNGTPLGASSDGTYTFPAGVTSISFSGRSADGSNAGGTNGGAGATFTGTIDVSALTSATGLEIIIPAAGSMGLLSIFVVGGEFEGSGVTVFSGFNGDTFVSEDVGEGGNTDVNSLSWFTASSSGANQSITGAGSDGSVTFSWSVAPAITRRDSINSLAPTFPELYE